MVRRLVQIFGPAQVPAFDAGATFVGSTRHLTVPRHTRAAATVLRPPVGRVLLRRAPVSCHAASGAAHRRRSVAQRGAAVAAAGDGEAVGAWLA